MALIVLVAGIALILARLLGAPRSAWRYILAAAGLAALVSQLLPAGHPLRADLAMSAQAFGWLLVALIPLTGYALWLRGLRRRAGTGGTETQEHPTGLVQISDDAALVSDTSAALDAETLRALGPARPLSLAWRTDAGVLAGHLRLIQAGSTGEISHLLVDPGHRGSGIGTRLVAAADAEARVRGLERLTVVAGSWQDAGFFTRTGFVTTAERNLGGGARRFWMERAVR